MAQPTSTSVMTISGRYVDPHDPEPGSVTLEDIAWALEGPAAISRFNGHTLRRITVTEHMLRVARITRRMAEGRGAGRARTDELELAALLHDAAEGITGDRLAPIKTEADSEMERKVLGCLLHGLGLTPALAGQIASLVHSHAVSTADRIACVWEAVHFQPEGSDWAWDMATSEQVIENLDLMWPRPQECWTSEVRRVLDLVQGRKAVEA